MPPPVASRPSFAWNMPTGNWQDADRLFNQGDVEKGQAEIREVVEYAHKAADAASASGKHLKETEIDLRKLEKRMHDIGESLIPRRPRPGAPGGRRNRTNPLRPDDSDVGTASRTKGES